MINLHYPAERLPHRPPSTALPCGKLISISYRNDIALRQRRCQNCVIKFPPPFPPSSSSSSSYSSSFLLLLFGAGDTWKFNWRVYYIHLYFSARFPPLQGAANVIFFPLSSSLPPSSPISVIIIAIPCSVLLPPPPPPFLPPPTSLIPFCFPLRLGFEIRKQTVRFLSLDYRRASSQFRRQFPLMLPLPIPPQYWSPGVSRS